MESIDKLKSKISANLDGYSNQVLDALREKAIEQTKTRFKNTLGLGLIAFLGLS
jgi:hypothetical protein